MCQVLDCSLSIFYIICRTQLIISNINLLTNGKYNNHDIEKIVIFLVVCLIMSQTYMLICRIIVVTKYIDILMKILIVHMCDIGFPQTF